MSKERKCPFRKRVTTETKRLLTPETTALTVATEEFLSCDEDCALWGSVARLQNGQQRIKTAFDCPPVKDKEYYIRCYEQGICPECGQETLYSGIGKNGEMYDACSECDFFSE